MGEWVRVRVQKLVDNYVLSAPVFDVATQQYVGFLDMKDLVSVVVFVADRKEEDHDHIRHLLKNLTTYRYPTDGLTVTCTRLRHGCWGPVMVVVAETLTGGAGLA